FPDWNDDMSNVAWAREALGVGCDVDLDVDQIDRCVHARAKRAACGNCYLAGRRVEDVAAGGDRRHGLSGGHSVLPRSVDVGRLSCGITVRDLAPTAISTGTEATT